MIKYVLYQNDKELNRFNKYNIFTNNIIYFKSKVFNLELLYNFKYNSKFNSEYNSEFNFNSTYKKFYINKLNQSQLNHLLSIREIITDAINNNFNSIMILEYDVIFHKEFNDLYDKYKQLIDNNSIIHLGSSQHKWYDIITGEKINIKEWKGIKYYNNSHSLGTFAIILKEDIYNIYIDFINYVLYEYQYFPSDVI